MHNFMSMANITPAEVGVVAAAIVLIFIAPALLAFVDARRTAALRAREWAVAAAQAAAAAVQADDLPSGLPGLDQTALVNEPLAEPPAHPASGDASAEPLTAAPVVLYPLEGTARFQCRLQDLHSARLPDWPPPAVRDDADRNGRWRAAEEHGEPHRGVITAATVWSPYPSRSYCLGSADVEGDTCYLRFLLFPVTWVVSQNQAVAQAVFALDRAGGVRGWVDALRPQELTEENRREIAEAGGEV